MKQKAILAALSGKAKDSELVILDKLELTAPKTKEMAAVVGAVVPGAKTAFLMISDRNESIARAARNIDKFKMGSILNINILDIVNHKYLVLTQDTVEALKKKYI